MSGLVQEGTWFIRWIDGFVKHSASLANPNSEVAFECLPDDRWDGVTFAVRLSRLITTDLVLLAESPRALIGRLDRERTDPLVAALYAFNARWGRGAVVSARAGLTTKRD